MDIPRIVQLSPAADIPPLDHVLVVKLAPGRFEVSGTAGLAPNAVFLPATTFDNQAEALQRAAEFARTHGIRCVHAKGFCPQAAQPTRGAISANDLRSRSPRNAA